MFAILTVVLSVGLLSFLIMKLRVNAFISLIITAIFVGIINGRPLADAISLTTTKLGGSLSGIAIVIGFAVISGQIMDSSGAAEKIARSILKITGDDKAPMAMVGTGYLLSIPLFSDTSYYLLIPIARALSSSSGMSFVAMVVAMGCGALSTHCFVPPTPGPLAMAQTLNVDLGLTMLIGIIVALFTATAGGWFYARWISKKVVIPRERYMEGYVDEGAKRELPSLPVSLLPILVPVILVSGNTLTNAFLPGTGFAKVMGVIGLPVVALGLSVLISYITLGIMRGKSLNDMSELMEKALRIGAMCILITGAGGAFGGVLVETGVGTAITNLLGNTGFSPLIFAWLVAAIFKTSQGSSATAMITVSAMFAPLLPTLNMSYNPAYLIMAIASGSMVFSWMNDSGFWVIAKLCNMTEKETLKTISCSSAVMSVVGLICTLLLSWIIPLA
ncbi:MAG: GntP family permease [Caldicoprobacterales bacterium]|jgi:gluconate transporter